jgi:DNA-binding SARP family transcriptional activator
VQTTVGEALTVRLLGELDLRLGDIPLPPLESARAESLLAYLLIHRGAPQPRQRLAFLLWPDSTEAQARTNLRHVLHKLRRALPDADRYLAITPRTLGWRPDAPLRLDLAAFEEALARADEAADSVEDLEAAVAAYAGDLLEGNYDEWLLEERERLRDRHRGALDRLSLLLAQRGDTARAIVHAERLLRHEPLREGTCRLLMRLHDARGERARALRVYHACAAALERDLGVEPSERTREAYEALLPGAAESEPERAVFVGRAPERQRLTALWREARRGRAQLVLVSGEAGIGKTRLVEELRTFCAHRGAATVEARSYPAEGTLAYGPIATWLRAEPLAARRHRLDRGRLAELARVLPELDEAPRPLPEREQRQRLFDALAHAIGGVEPLLLVADDVQWCDPETLQFLHYLVRSRPDARLLVAATVRREELDAEHGVHELVAGLGALDRVTEIALPRLSPQETAVLAERLAGTGVDAGRLFAETEGNPLFVVETLRAGWAGGALTPRVQSVIEARLAQLSEPAGRLAAVAAAVGREFTADVLARASGADEEALVRGLDELWRRRIVRDRGPEAYDFTHDKLREVAYLALGPAERSRTHLRIAHALEALHSTDHAQLALHHDRAGAVEPAVDRYQQAAAAAQRMHAHGDAVRLLERALALAPAPARQLSVITDIAAPLATVAGFSSPRLVELQQRGLELAGELGVDPAPPLLRSLAVVSVAAGDFEATRRYGRLLAARGELDGDEALLVESDYVLGIAAFWQGHLAEARTHFEAAVAAYRPEDRVTNLLRYGFDTRVICLGRLANTRWFLGDPEAAVAARDRALELAEEIDDPTTLDIALVFAALLALELEDVEGLRAYVARFAGDDVPSIAPMREAYSGYLDVVDGRNDGVARIQRAVASTRGQEHAPGMHAMFARILVGACVKAGDVEAGLAVPVPDGLFAGMVRRLQAELRSRGTIAERPAPDPPGP